MEEMNGICRRLMEKDGLHFSFLCVSYSQTAAMRGMKQMIVGTSIVNNRCGERKRSKAPHSHAPV
jgi:hypothetical protein